MLIVPSVSLQCNFASTIVVPRGAALSRALDQNLVVHRALILLTLGVIVWAVLQ